jgi:hypothetical protein
VQKESVKLAKPAEFRRSGITRKGSNVRLQSVASGNGSGHLKIAE